MNINIKDIKEVCESLANYKKEKRDSFTESLINILKGEQKKMLQAKVKKLGPILEIYVSSEFDVKAFEGIKDMIKINQSHLLPEGTVMFSWYDMDDWENNMKYLDIRPM